MPFLLKDETANVNVIYIDNLGQVGLMGSANAGQALSFAGAGVITNGAYFADLVATAGCPSSLTGTVVIPVGSSGNVTYSVAQPPTVTSNAQPDSVTNTAATFSNGSSSPLTVNYNIW